MAKADLQQAKRRLRRLEELVRDQRRRLGECQARGDAVGADKAAALLAIFQQTLESAQQMAQAQRRSHGVEEP
jgi:hypothetical protein